MEGGHKRILLVDDESMLTTLNKLVLERLGYSVTAFERAAEALQAFQDDANGFDLLLTDQAMPGMTGLQLATEVRKLRPDMPIVLATGFSEDVDEKARSEAGITELILKPVNMTKLDAAIRRALQIAVRNP